MRLGPSVLFALVVLLAAPAAHAERTLGSVRFERCELLAPPRLGGPLAAECGRLAVPLDPQAADGPTIDLALALIPARRKRAEPDPVVFFAGGPGQSALESFPYLARAFRRVLDHRHVLLIDQRGTGQSAPLHCPLPDPDDPLAEPSDSATLRRLAEECRASLAHDPRFFATQSAVEDVERVRQAIGAAQLNLVGISYGTRVAQQYAKRYPERVRSLLLDGIVPPDLILGSEHGRNLDAAIEAMIARCRNDAECSARFPDVRGDLDALRIELTAHPRTVRLRHPRSGERIERRLTLGTLALLVRMYSYGPETIALLPLVLHQARSGDVEPLLAQAITIAEQMRSAIAHGMQLSVICTEDAPALGAAVSAEADSLLGTSLIDLMQAQCAVWPTLPAAADMHRPMTSTIPALLLSGEFDPVTPPRYGERAVTQFERGRHLVVPGQGHGVLMRGCVPRLIERFLVELDPAGLDADCLARLSPEPFFLGPNGAAP